MNLRYFNFKERNQKMKDIFKNRIRVKDIFKNRIRMALADGQTHTAKSLGLAAIITETEDTSPRTRALIREMVEDGELIGSSSAGYKNLTTAKEVQKYMNSLMKRQMAVSARILAVYNAAKGKGLV
jgi:hypothetical protein